MIKQKVWACERRTTSGKCGGWICHLTDPEFFDPAEECYLISAADYDLDMAELERLRDSNARLRDELEESWRKEDEL